MSYVKLNTDGSESPVGVIIGYVVQYMERGKQKQSQRFNTAKDANGFKMRLKLTSRATIVPVWGK